jgi:hypothetical protein
VTENRRNDVGAKVALGLMSSIVLLLLTVIAQQSYSFIAATKQFSEDNRMLITAISLRVEKMETLMAVRLDSMGQNLTEINALLRRTSPFERGGP